MTSIVRIKRRPSQEPAEALLLAAKRPRVEDNVESGKVNAVEQNVFRFCGTTENEKENVEYIAKLVEKGKLMAHRQPLKAYRSSSHTTKPSDSVSNNSEKKYKVLNTLRQLDDTEDTLKIYDLVLEREEQKPDVPTCNGVPFVVEKCEVAKVDPEEKYVYDFYYSDRGVIDDSYIDSLMSVQPYYFHPEEHVDSDIDDSDDDSNDENNWRNDYPDTEEEGECDADIVGKMCGMYLDGEDDLSSEDEDFVYAKDDGDAYSRFKERVTKELMLGLSSGSEDDSDLEGYD